MKPKQHYRLEQLAKLGLPKEIFIRAFLQELHNNLDSMSNSFCWHNANGSIGNIYAEHHDITSIDNFIYSVIGSVDENIKYSLNLISSIQSIKLSSELIEQIPSLEAFYGRVTDSMGYAKSCFVPILNPINKAHIGLLIIHRSVTDKKFSPYEIDFLNDISNLMVKGLVNATSKRLNTLSDDWKQGTLIVDNGGNVLQACYNAISLAKMANLTTMNNQAQITKIDLTAFKNYKKVVQKLAIPNNHENFKDKRITLSLNNAWGEFNLRGFLLKDGLNNEQHKIGFYICWQEPFILKLFHRIPALKLTPREESVSLLYAVGDQHNLIADKLDLSNYTIKEYIKNISEKLNVSSRSELLEAIICRSQ